MILGAIKCAERMVCFLTTQDTESTESTEVTFFTNLLQLSVRSVPFVVLIGLTCGNNSGL